MKLLADIRKLALSSLGMLAVSAFVLTACDSTIYDYEGDCDPHFKVGFRYDMNMKFVDAFSTEAKSVSQVCQELREHSGCDGFQQLHDGR